MKETRLCNVTGVIFRSALVAVDLRATRSRRVHGKMIEQIYGETDSAPRESVASSPRES